jgi:cell division protein FtsQ
MPASSDPASATSSRRRNRTVVAPEESAEPGVAPEASSNVARLGWAVGRFLVVLALLGASMTGVVIAANRFLTTTSRFAVVKISAEGSRRFGEEQLLQLAGAKRGDNLFALDLDKMEERLTENAWISSAKLTRHLPDTIEIVVSEHVAAALSIIDQELYLVTRSGQPIQPVTDTEIPNLPVISGVTGDDVRTDRPRALERIAQGIGIVERYDRMPIAKVYGVQEVHLSAEGAVTLVVGESGISLVLGTGPIKPKLLMAARIIGKVKERGQVPKIIFLDNQAHPERVVVRMR